MNTASGKRWIYGCAALFFGASAASGNLLYNTSFELESAFSYGSALNWKLNDPDDHGDAYGSASRENWRAHDGQFLAAIRGTWAGLGDYGGWWQEAEGKGNISYRASAWFYADAGWKAQTQDLKLEFWNWDRTQLLGSAVNGLYDLREEWTRHEVNAVSPEGTEWVRVVIHASGAGEAGALQVDDVELVATP